MINLHLRETLTIKVKNTDFAHLYKYIKNKKDKPEYTFIFWCLKIKQDFLNQH